MALIEMLKNKYNKILDAKYRRKIYKELKNNINLSHKIKENEAFKDIHKGERCFVIGNGPSLNTEDLSTLENEIVFTVNKIANHPDFYKLRSNYHFWADPSFCSLSPEKEEDIALVESMKAVSTETNTPVCFFPNIAMEMIEQFKLDQVLDIKIYHAAFEFKDGENREIDFSKSTFAYQTVVQYAIAMAIYMGFSEIYLLGCDTTGIVSTIQAVTNQEVTQYSYKVDANEKKFLKNMAFNRPLGMESDFLGWARILHLYRELCRYCESRGVKLINCSSTTIVDSIPRKTLADVLKCEK